MSSPGLGSVTTDMRCLVMGSPLEELCDKSRVPALVTLPW